MARSRRRGGPLDPWKLLGLLRRRLPHRDASATDSHPNRDTDHNPHSIADFNSITDIHSIARRNPYEHPDPGTITNSDHYPLADTFTDPDRLPNALFDGNTHTNARSTATTTRGPTHSNANTHHDANTHAHTAQNADGHPDANPTPHSDTDADTNGNNHPDANAFAGARTDTNTQDDRAGR